MAVATIYPQIHRLHLFRHCICHTPSGKSKIGIPPVTDTVCVRLSTEIFQSIKTIFPIVNIGNPFSLRTAGSPTPLINKNKSALAVFSGVQLQQLFCMRITAALYYDRICFSFRKGTFQRLSRELNDCTQFHSIAHRKHPFPSFSNLKLFSGNFVIQFLRPSQTLLFRILLLRLFF